MMELILYLELDGVMTSLDMLFNNVALLKLAEVQVYMSTKIICILRIHLNVFSTGVNDVVLNTTAFRFQLSLSPPIIFAKKMREIFSGVWPYMIVMLFFIAFLTRLYRNKNVEKTKYKLPPGRRGWPLIGDSFNWFNAVASSHPPSFVEEQVKRY